MTVSAAGRDVTMGTPGAAVFSSIKSGNVFKGLQNITYEDDSFVGDNLDDSDRRRGDTGQPNLLFWEGHTDLVGGPIVKDKAWFYMGYIHFYIDKQVSGVNAEVATDVEVFNNYTVKGTVKPNSKDALITYYQWSRKEKPLRGLSATIGRDSALAQKSDAWMYNVQHQRVWSNRLFTDLKLGRFGFGWPMVPSVHSPTDDGKTVIKAFYGRYYFNSADRLDNVNSGSTNTKDFRFNDLNGNRLFDGPQELGALVASAGGTSTTLDPDLKTPYSDEISVSYERQFWGESSVRVAYVRKQTRDEFTTFNVRREGQFVGGGDYDYDYDTLQFGFNKRFGGGLFIQSSFDYQWRDELRQNSNTNSPLNSDPLGIGFFQNVFPEVSNRQNSTNWQAHLLGRYVFPYEVGVTTSLRAQSGWQYARFLWVSLPNAGTQTFFRKTSTTTAPTTWSSSTSECF